MTIRIQETDLHVLNMRTRMPFKYGIATLTALPHLFVRVTVEVDGRTRQGIASDGLPPKWFTKDPEAPFHAELADMFAVIRAACHAATDAPPAPDVFTWWRQVYEAQREWAADTPHPPLLWAFGVSLVERAVIDAWCRATKTTFGEALRTNSLGARLGELHGELADAAPSDQLPAQPLRRVIARHTVGLADPLTDADIAPADRLDDGLPQSLEACIDAYGLTHFKIKLCGDVARDTDRLTTLARVVSARSDRFAFTLDGNEQYRQVEPFRVMWAKLNEDANVRRFMRGLLFVEQPFHRDVALSDELGAQLQDWADRPAIIIDESDGSLTSARAALAMGYTGTSHKNCKGVFKGVANACLIAHRRRGRGAEGRDVVISGEDLANVGPVALLQDLTVAANLGVEHVERNGHHYFTGLSMLPSDLQDDVLARHGDLYRRHARGYPTVDIRGGAVDVGSLIEAPFGVDVSLDPTRFTPLDQWRYESLDA